jgi:hypothetical protein
LSSAVVLERRSCVQREESGQQFLVGEMRERNRQPRPGRERSHEPRCNLGCLRRSQEMRHSGEDDADRLRKVDNATERWIFEHSVGISQVRVRDGEPVARGQQRPGMRDHHGVVVHVLRSGQWFTARAASCTEGRVGSAAPRSMNWPIPRSAASLATAATNSLSTRTRSRNSGSCSSIRPATSRSTAK